MGDDKEKYKRGSFGIKYRQVYCIHHTRKLGKRITSDFSKKRRYLIYE